GTAANDVTTENAESEIIQPEQGGEQDEQNSSTSITETLAEITEELPLAENLQTIQVVVKPKKSNSKKGSSKKLESDDDVFEDENQSAKLGRSGYSKRRKTDESSSWKVPNSNGFYRKLVRFCERCTRRYLPWDTEDKSTICHACEGIISSKSSLKKKSFKRRLLPDQNDSVPLLRDVCIKVIAENIDSLEEFGLMDDQTKIRISKIISRRRQLDTNNMKLFLGPQEHRVELFDCTKIDNEGFEMVAHFCPNVRTLNLSSCGRILDSAIELFGRLAHLTSLNLQGCFLVTDKAFKTLFSGVGLRLLEIELHNAAKMSSSIETLVEKCTNIRKLAFVQCQNVDDDSLNILKRLSGLESLQLSYLSEGISNETLTALMESFGKSLKDLRLNG
ncbi:hypothetical protein HK096_010821, partial [Nowakowskiella sp. JEL0078]